MRIKLAITLAAAISAALTLTAQAQTTYYVNGACGDDAWAGTSPVCVAPDGPKKTIQAGIDASVSADTVIVADGTYTGAGNRDLDFAGRDIHLRSESLDPSLCIIDCQGSAVDPHRGFHFHSGETAAAIVEGFTITNGFVTRASPGGDNGGGMLNENSSPTVRNCTFDSNIAQRRGGGMYNDVSSPTVTNCTFSLNTASRGAGGGMHNRNGSSPTVTDCTFSGNLAAGPLGAGAGGGMINVGSSPTVTNCTFSGNMSVADAGGGMANVEGSSPIVTNCTFNNNTAPFGGGMFNRFDASPTVTACTFDSNIAGLSGGGMHNGDNSSPTVTDCSFDTNIAQTRGGGMYNDVSSPRVTNCTFSANTAGDNGLGGEGGGGMHNRNGSNPTVTDCTFSGNTGAGGGMLNAFSSSSIVRNCTFTGNISAADSAGGMGNIFDSSPIVTNCTFNNNTTALNGGGMFNRFDSSPIVTNCTFESNFAQVRGGGMANFNSSNPRVTNCTFSGNTAVTGGGIHTSDAFGGHSSPRVTNTIAWDNTPDQIRDDRGATTTVTYSDVQGGWTGAGGTGNINADPLFVDPGTGNYHISPGSRVIDAADNTAVPPGVTTDLDGNPRFLNDPLSPNTGVRGNGHAEIVDMGAYEFPGELCYADCDRNGTFDIFDFLCFQNSFVNGEPYACDCDPDPACDIFDFLCFQDAFVAGCP